MCGRYVSASDPEALARYFDATLGDTVLPPNYNVAPTTDVYAVVAGRDGTRRLTVVHWGLIPAWAKDRRIGQRMINARAETLATKGSFKPLFRSHRCLVPADGFYEWKAVPGAKRKQPYYIHRPDGEPLAMAGLWTSWRDPAAPPDTPWLQSATIITTDANATVRPLHDRMPAIIPASAWAEWLDPTNDDLVSLGRLLVPAPEGLLTLHPVSTEVNSVRNRGAHLIDEVPPVDGPASGG